MLRRVEYFLSWALRTSDRISLISPYVRTRVIRLIEFLRQWSLGNFRKQLAGFFLLNLLFVEDYVNLFFNMHVEEVNKLIYFLVYCLNTC